MKQMKECLDRVFDGRPPLKHKLGAVIETIDGIKYLLVRHYQHCLLIYNIDTDTIEYEWWEFPTDKRCLEAAKEYLNDRRKQNESN